MRDRTQHFVERRILEKLANFENIALFETPNLLNVVELTNKGVQQLKILSIHLLDIVLGIFMLIPSVLLSAYLAWWIPLVLLSCASPGIYFEMKYRQQSWNVEKNQASVVREMNLYKIILTGEGYAKELRLLHLQPLLLERWQGLFRTMFTAMEHLRRRGITKVVLWSLLNWFGIALPYTFVVMGVMGKTYTLGDLALYSGLILQVRQSLAHLIFTASHLYDMSLGTIPIYQLLESQSQLSVSQTLPKKTSRTVQNSFDTQFKGIQIQNLSFTYPNSDRSALRDINLTIQPNEMVALVGENGSGKTTLTKLLCRFYQPRQGAIIWNGQDLQSLNLEDLHSRIAVVMQDYARFPCTLRENVAFGDLAKIQDDYAITEALTKAGLGEVIGKLDGGLETILGKQLEGGTDLSGGQWQRLAIARALLRLSTTELLILDEATANLDPKTEHDIHTIFHALAKGRIAVIVTHRLALAKLADRVVVLENGQILEVGTHDELMILGGQYYSMFTRQAGSYC